MENAVKKNRILIHKVNKVEDRKTIIIPYGEDTLELEYSRAKYTPAFEREIKRLMDDNLPTGSFQ